MNFGNEILIYFVWHVFMILNIIVLRCCVHTLTSSISCFFLQSTDILLLVKLSLLTSAKAK
jgi:hypothetical protein